MDTTIESTAQLAVLPREPRRNSRLIQGYLGSADFSVPGARLPRPSLAFVGAASAAATVAVVAWIGAAVPALAALGG